ncbi:DUF1513 domain-containing protein [Nitratireductor pacificus]|uniref:Twin-arginine translocation pathway signal n=1 Tax=Nitratireductor pacificus pht-3B TaxID=391937 RepID=K2MI59_9HYPH|nr:DUF1513 domain-containing protein [Nitratireductor pacificus]EKF20405.1 hypothetical protein NA2_04087 [Nitratireductor pacificus pht-3B]
MRSTEIDRRTFLALGGAALLLPAEAARAADEALFLGARLRAGGFEAAVIDAAGRDRLVLPLEARGHSFAIDAPRRRAVAFARSPGRFAVGFAIDGGEDPVAFAPPPDRHFYGHGVFTPDGRLLLATENDFAGERGVTGLYDATDGFRRVGEFATGGIGPHELVLMRDGRTLCIANGGILTHPDYERVKLNLATMKPNLAYVDCETGDLLEEAELAPELHQLSIRHMVLDGQGHVWFGAQYQGEDSATPPLVGRHRRGHAIELFTGPEATLKALDNYVGSVSTDLSGEIVATSSPRGGIAVFWDAATGKCLGERVLKDGCGLAPLGPRQLIETSGRGAIVRTGPDGATESLRREAADAPAWDNHLRRV